MPARELAPRGWSSRRAARAWPLALGRGGAASGASWRSGDREGPQARRAAGDFAARTAPRPHGESADFGVDVGALGAKACGVGCRSRGRDFFSLPLIAGARAMGSRQNGARRLGHGGGAAYRAWCPSEVESRWAFDSRSLSWVVHGGQLWR